MGNKTRVRKKNKNVRSVKTRPHKKGKKTRRRNIHKNA